MSEVYPNNPPIFDAACRDCPYVDLAVDALQSLRAEPDGSHAIRRQIQIFEAEDSRFIETLDEYQCSGPEAGVDSPSGCPAYMKSKGLEIPTL